MFFFLLVGFQRDPITTEHICSPFSRVAFFIFASGSRGNHPPTVDGRNPAPPKKPWNDDSPVKTNEQWFPMVSTWCRILSIHSIPFILAFWGEGGRCEYRHSHQATCRSVAEESSRLRARRLRSGPGVRRGGPQKAARRSRRVFVCFLFHCLVFFLFGFLVDWLFFFLVSCLFLFFFFWVGFRVGPLWSTPPPTPGKKRKVNIK